MAVIDTRQQHDKYKEVRLKTAFMSEDRGMSDAAVAASANSLSPDWVRSELRCTKAGLREVRLKTEFMSEDRDMSDAAVAAGANSLSPD